MRAGGGRRCAGRHQPDELRARRPPTARVPPPPRPARRSRAAPPPPSPRRSCSPGRRPRAAGRARAPARPESRRRVSRTTAAIARATSTSPRRLTLNAISGLPRADEHTAGGRVEPRGPEVRRELAGVDPLLEPLGPAAPEERRPAARRELAVEEHRQPSSSPIRRASRERRLAARAPCPRGRIGTSGTTSAAPMRGWAPSCRRRSIRSRAHAIPASSVSTSSVVLADEREDGAVVVGVDVDVEQPRGRGERRARARRSPSRRGPRRSSARTPARVVP